MIQELLSAVVEERKLSFLGSNHGRLLSDDSPSHPFLYAASTATTTTLSPSSSSSTIQPSSSPSQSTGSDPPQQKLRCPRCDSSNTKFCYYNNYNLTQPRHFCKTCRRYWTKGGALRNVPIGGGCRKAKPAPVVACGGGKSGGGNKPNKSIPSFDAIARAGFGFEPDLFSPSPILWTGPTPSPPQPPPNASHLLALLRAGGGAGIRSFEHNPLSSLNSIRIKEERMMGEAAGGELAPNFDPLLCQFSSAAAGMGSLWKNNEGPPPYVQLQENGAQFGDAAAGIQELYQRLRPQGYCNDQLSIAMSNGWSVPGYASPATPATLASNIGGGGGSSNAAAAGVEPAMGGEFGYWNPAFSSSWSDMPSTN